ncbi:MAG: hypothetical protein ABI615_11110 [Chthoniobacterales bacterium]
MKIYLYPIFLLILFGLALDLHGSFPALGREVESKISIAEKNFHVASNLEPTKENIIQILTKKEDESTASITQAMVVWKLKYANDQQYEKIIDECLSLNSSITILYRGAEALISVDPAKAAKTFLRITDNSKAELGIKLLAVRHLINIKPAGDYKKIIMEGLTSLNETDQNTAIGILEIIPDKKAVKMIQDEAKNKVDASVLKKLNSL